MKGRDKEVITKSGVIIEEQFLNNERMQMFLLWLTKQKSFPCGNNILPHIRFYTEREHFFLTSLNTTVANRNTPR
jgi:hypothetical protein